MPFPKKDQRPQNKSRKPLSSFTNTRQKSKKQKSNSRKLNKQQFKVNSYIDSQTATTINSIRNSEQVMLSRTKQSIIDKYYKRQKKDDFPQISIIEEKPSFASINQQNSLDSLNNYMIEGNKMQKSVKQNSKQQAQSEELQNWSLLQNMYKNILQNDIDTVSKEEKYYLQRINQFQNGKRRLVKKLPSTQQPPSPIIHTQYKLQKQIYNQIKQFQQKDISYLGKKNQKSQQLQQRLLTIMRSKKQKQSKSSNQNQKNSQLINSNEISEKSDNTLIKLPTQQQTKLKQLNVQQIQQKVLQQLSAQQNKQFVAENQDKQEFKAQQQQIALGQDDYNQQKGQQQDQNQGKGQQLFFKFYNQKKYSSDNQGNLTINNISKIMLAKPKESNNKSQQYENEIKQNEKQQDQVVAMLQNQLRDKKYPSIPEKQQSQNLLKQERDNLCLNQLDAQIQNQNNILQNQQQQNSSIKNNFFFVLQARQKWIKSLDKSQKWKNIQLSILSKMKKILHNPYIQFTQENDQQLQF